MPTRGGQPPSPRVRHDEAETVKLIVPGSGLPCRSLQTPAKIKNSLAPSFCREERQLCGRAEIQTIFRASAEWPGLQGWRPRPTALGRELGVAQEPRFLPLRLKPRFSIPAKRASIKFAATLGFQRARFFPGLAPTGLARSCGNAGGIVSCLQQSRKFCGPESFIRIKSTRAPVPLSRFRRSLSKHWTTAATGRITRIIA